MQTKKRAKAVKFGKKIDKPATTEKEAPKAATLVEQKIQEEEKETPPEKIESKPIDPQPEEQQIPQEEEPKIREEETKITEIKQTESEEITIETKSEPPQETVQEPQEPPIEPPKEPPIESSPEPEKAQEETIRVEETEEYVIKTEKKKNFLGYFMIISILSFVIGLLSMAAINFFNQKSQPSDNQKNTAVTTKLAPTNTPSPTQEPLDLSKYNIKVLNGSGVTGAASKLKESLAGVGFTVTTTGNATTNNYTDTTIIAGKDVNPEYLKKLKTVLSESYTLASDSASSDESTTGADVIIIIGKN